jgi:hypothetical protein
MSEIQRVVKRVLDTKVEGRSETFSADLPIDSIDGIPGDFSISITKYPREYPTISCKNQYVFSLETDLPFIDEYKERLTFLDKATIPEEESVEHLNTCIAKALTKIKDLKWVESFQACKFTSEEKEEKNPFDVLKDFKNITLKTRECSVCYEQTPYETDCGHPLCARCCVACAVELDNGCPICRRDEFIPLSKIVFKNKDKLFY